MNFRLKQAAFVMFSGTFKIEIPKASPMITYEKMTNTH